MHITPEVFNHLAHLARLQFSTAEQQPVQHSMEQLITYMQQLQQVDTSNVAPLLTMTQHYQQPRADAATQEHTTTQILQNAPSHNGQYIQVPKVINQLP